MRFPYREFIYSNKIFDFYIADTSPNFFVIFIYVFFYKWRNPEKQTSFFLILGALGGSILYEFVIQPLTSIQTVDNKDIIASIFGSIICAIISMKIEKQNLVEFLNFKIPHKR